MNSIATYLLLYLLLTPAPPTHFVECNLSKTLDSGFLTAKYSSSWKAYHYGGRHSLMYYEEANFDRREDAEITFDKIAIPDSIKVDTMNSASMFLSEQLHIARNDPKLQQANLSIKISDESIENINGNTWHRVVVAISGIEENKRVDATATFYFRYTQLVVYTVAFRVTMPKIPTVEKEFPCILKSIKFIK